MFQSHNGAIAARWRGNSCRWGSQMFQSHNGAIAAEMDRLLSEFLYRFNPTMVRLLLANHRLHLLK